VARARIKKITLHQVEHVAFYLAQKHLSFDEPIPEFATRFPNSLESCLALPFQSVYGRTLYPSLTAKAAVLFYLLIKNHPFVNGNKRVALMTLLVFLDMNSKWISVDTATLHALTVWIAQSPAPAKDQVVEYIEKFLHKHLVDS
jgi:death-on-curing protein